MTRQGIIRRSSEKIQATKHKPKMPKKETKFRYVMGV
jgi:hypothetical protein